jgi:hypothetical protein
MYSKRIVDFEDCEAMATAVVRCIDEPTVFKAMHVCIKKNAALRGLACRVLSRQRDDMINGHEPATVGSSEIAMYTDVDVVAVPWCAKSARPVRSRDMDRNAAHFFESIAIRPAALADAGLVVCGGCLVECSLAESPPDREYADHMRELTGFDVDMFITGDVPYKGCVMAYAEELEAHVRESPVVRGVEVHRRGFCVDVMVYYSDMRCVKMQIVDLGVQASPMQIVSSFDISVAKMYFCPTTSRIMMTEDAAYSLANGAIPYDRRYVEDPRYPQRLRKYVDRTGYALVLDDIGAASARVSKHVADRVIGVLDSAAAEKKFHLCEVLCSWLEELGVSDTNVLTMSLLGRHIGKGSCMGYGTKKRVPDCPQLTGTCGRFGLRQVARRGDPLTELHAMFLLSKVLRSLLLIA